jgi:type IV secretion system pilin
MKKWKQLIMGLSIVAGISLAALPSSPAHAINVFDQCANNADSAVCKSTGDKAPSMIQIVINTALMVLGMISVLMIVIGGIRYTTSNGNATHVKEAKDTILYAIVGLVVAILSYTIVNFVVSRF